MMPSFTPSSASHASITDFASSFVFAAVKNPPGAYIACDTRINCKSNST